MALGCSETECKISATLGAVVAVILLYVAILSALAKSFHLCDHLPVFICQELLSFD